MVPVPKLFGLINKNRPPSLAVKFLEKEGPISSSDNIDSLYPNWVTIIVIYNLKTMVHSLLDIAHGQSGYSNVGYIVMLVTYS